MYNYFHIVYCKTNLDKDFFDVLKELIGNNIEIVSKDNLYLIYHSYAKEEEINSMIMSFSDELMIDIVSYQSFFHDDVNRQKEEVEIASELVKELPTGVYNFK